MNNINSKRKFALSAITAVLAITFCGSARADVITEWNQNAQQALLTAKTSPAVSTRVLAIVQVAVFDAVNGIERRYTPIHADFDVPGVVRYYSSFTQAADEAFNARIYGGIHFRSACRDGRALGTHIWSLVMTDVAQPIYGQRKGQINHNHPTGDIGAEGEIPSE